MKTKEIWRGRWNEERKRIAGVEGSSLARSGGRGRNRSNGLIVVVVVRVVRWFLFLHYNRDCTFDRKCVSVSGHSRECSRSGERTDDNDDENCDTCCNQHSHFHVLPVNIQASSVQSLDSTLSLKSSEIAYHHCGDCRVQHVSLRTISQWSITHHAFPNPVGTFPESLSTLCESIYITAQCRRISLSGSSPR